MGFIKACDVSELPQYPAVMGVEVDDEPVLIARDEQGELHAVNNVCSHQYVLMSEDDDVEIEGCELECWLHAARFDVRTGEALQLPATEPLDVYPIKIDGDDVLIDVAAPINR